MDSSDAEGLSDVYILTTEKNIYQKLASYPEIVSFRALIAFSGYLFSDERNERLPIIKAIVSVMARTEIYREKDM